MGKPAARLGDMHVCPMVTPGVPPIPHVGGPVTGPGMPTVLIGSVPAAVMGDMCVCVGPPDTIILGSTGVMIGGKPAARMGDMTSHGGTVTVGLPTVLIGEVMPGSPPPPVIVPPTIVVVEPVQLITSKVTVEPLVKKNEAAGSSLPANAGLKWNLSVPNPTDSDPVKKKYQASNISHLSDNEYSKWKESIGKKESSGNYEVVNTIGYIGKYQFGVGALEDTGYVKKGTYKSNHNNSVLDNDEVWTGKDGVKSKKDFLSNQQAQEKAMDQYTNQNYKTLQKKGVVNENTSSEKTAGLLAVSHNQGAGAAVEFERDGKDGKDGYGTTRKGYYDYGAGSINSTPNSQSKNSQPDNQASYKPDDGTSFA